MMKDYIVTVVQIFILFFVVIDSHYPQWKNNGPEGGPVNRIFKYQDKLLAQGESRASYFESANAGSNWTQRRFSDPVGLANQLFPAEDFLLLAATNGVFVSIDNGFEWKSLGLTQFNINLLYANDSVIVASSDSDYINKGLFVFTNSTLRWRKTSYTGAEINAIVLDGSKIIVGTNEDGFYLSPDLGFTWNRLDSGFTSDLDNFTFSLVKQDSIIVALTRENIYYLKDGSVWTKLYGGELSFQGSIAVNKNNICSSFEKRIVISTDYGHNWTAASQVDSTWVNSLLFYGDTIFAGTEAGLYRSSDLGRTWLPSYSGIIGEYIYAFDINDQSIITSGEGGIYVSKDKANSWMNATADLWRKREIFFFNVAVLDNYLFTSPGTGVKRSADDGKHWVDLGSITAQLSHLVTTKKDIYAINTDMEQWLRSTDYGDSWELNSIGGNTRFYNSVIRSNGEYIIYNSKHGLFRVSWGESYDNISPDTSDLDFINIAVNRNQVLTFNFGKMFLSNDTGSVWTEVIMPGFIPEAIAVSDSVIISSANGRTYYTMDRGKTWKRIKELDRIIIEDMLAYDTTLYISTKGNGVITNYISQIDSGNIPVGISRYSLEKYTFMLQQNFPNPFNPITTITYLIPKQTYVKIKVFDMLGRQVSGLVDKEQKAGEYKVQFDGSRLPSGAYVYSIEAGDYRDAKKLIILK